MRADVSEEGQEHLTDVEAIMFQFTKPEYQVKQLATLLSLDEAALDVVLKDLSVPKRNYVKRAVARAR